MLPKFSRSRSSSAPLSPASSSHPLSPSKSSGLPKPWPSCLPLPRSRTRKRDFPLQLSDPALPSSSSSPPGAFSSHGHVRTSSSQLPHSLLRELQLAFEQFDVNNDGRISADELCAVLRSLGDNATEAEALQMVGEVDSDGDGCINLQEFIDLNTRCLRATGELASIDELTATFDMFDLDKNGCITAEDLHSVLMKLGGRNYTVADCERMIRGVDRKGAGHVDFDDFKRMMMTSA